MKIRRAKHGDFCPLVHFARTFCVECGFTYDIREITNLIAEELSSQYSIILVAEEDHEVVGAFMGFVCRNVFSGKLVAQDRFCYVLPKFRNKVAAHQLFLSFQTWAKELGCAEITLCAFGAKDNDSLKNVLIWLGCARKGYILTKTL